MKTIFTYPYNITTDYIAPLYVGDSNSGFTKRVDDLLAGTYKDWLGLDPVTDLSTTTSEAMENFSKFCEYLDDVKLTDNITTYDLWYNPIVVANKSASAGPNEIQTANYQGQLVINTTTPHTFQTGDEILISGADGTLGKFYSDAGSTQIYVGNTITSTSFNVPLVFDLDDPQFISVTTSDMDETAHPGPGSYPVILVDDYDGTNGATTPIRINFGNGIKHLAVGGTYYEGPQVNAATGDVFNMPTNIGGNDYPMNNMQDQDLYLEAVTVSGYGDGWFELYTDQARTNKVFWDDWFAGTGTQIDDAFNESPGRIQLLNATTGPDGLYALSGDDSTLATIWLQDPFEFMFPDTDNEVSGLLYAYQSGSVGGVSRDYQLYKDEAGTQPLVFNNEVSDDFNIHFRDFTTPDTTGSYYRDQSSDKLTVWVGPTQFSKIPYAHEFTISGLTGPGSDLNGETVYVEKNTQFGSTSLYLHRNITLTDPILRSEVNLSDEVINIEPSATALGTSLMLTMSIPETGALPETNRLITRGEVNSQYARFVATEDNPFYGINAGDELQLSGNLTPAYDPYNITQGATLLAQTFQINNIPTNVIPNATGDNFVKLWYNDDHIDTTTLTKLYFVSDGQNVSLSGDDYFVEATGRTTGGVWREYKLKDPSTSQYLEYTGGTTTVDFTPISGGYPGKATLGRQLAGYEQKVTLIDAVLDTGGGTLIAAGTPLWLVPDGTGNYIVYADDTTSIYNFANVDTTTVTIAPMWAGSGIQAQKYTSTADAADFKFWGNGLATFTGLNAVNDANLPTYWKPRDGYVAGDYTDQAPALTTQGIVSLTGGQYMVSSVDIISGGNKVYQYLSGEDTYTPGAKIIDDFYPAGQERTSPGAGETAAEFTPTVDGNGRLASVAIDTAGLYDSSDPILLILENDDDTYTPPTPTASEQQDIWETDDWWDDLGKNNNKLWPTHVTPSSASISQSSASIVNSSQNGTNFVKTSSFTKWSMEVTYPPMSADEFRKFHAVSQAANGQANPFLFKLRSKEGDHVLWSDFGRLNTTSDVLFRNDYDAGSKLVMVEGLDSFETDAFVEGEVMFVDTDNNQNGNLVTVVNATDANVFGEAQIRLAYPLRNNIVAGASGEKDPEYAVVTLGSSDFQYTVDYNGYYYVAVTFALDGWK